MVKLPGIGAFLAVIDNGSISAAARQLGISKSVVSERLGELERDVGARLLHRTTRRLSLTEDGRTFQRRARRIMQELTDAATELSERRRELSGPLRLSGPVSFGMLHLGPAVSAFMKAHPKIEMNLELDDRFVDAASDGFDAVVRHSAIAESRLVVKRIAPSRRLLVASPDYLERSGTPRTLDDLELHKAILYTNRGSSDWLLQRGGRRVSPRVVHCLRVNNGLVMRDAAVEGLGIALLPVFLVHEQLDAGTLLPLDIGCTFDSAAVFMAYPSGGHVSAKVTALLSWLRRYFGNPPYWETKKSPPKRALS
jgi:DNA-binding transcriptional LysR family regulator